MKQVMFSNPKMLSKEVMRQILKSCDSLLGTLLEVHMTKFFFYFNSLVTFTVDFVSVLIHKDRL